LNVTRADGTGRIVWESSNCLSEFLSRSHDWCFLGLIQTILGPGRRLALNSELDLVCSIVACKLGAREVVATDGVLKVFWG
jgi:hypothetical protein